MKISFNDKKQDSVIDLYRLLRILNITSGGLTWLDIENFVDRSRDRYICFHVSCEDIDA